MEQSTDAPTGFSNSLKLTATTADADYGSGSSQTNVHTRIEAQDLQHLKCGTASAENLTLSFWVKSSVTGTYLTWFYQEDDARHCTKTYTINAANTWEYKTVTISGDTTGVIDNDNGVGMQVRWLLATGSIFTSGTYLDGSWANFTNADTYAGHAVNVASSTNNTFYLTGAQLEVGSVATPFERRSYGQELALCQRYFVSMNVTGFHWQAATTTRANGVIVLPSVMRSSPVLTCEDVNRITNFGVLDYNGTYTFGGENTTPTQISASYTRSSGDSWTANIPLAINSTTLSTILTANSEL